MADITHPPKKGALLVYRSDRLGARLIAMINALRLGQLLDLPVHVRWEQRVGNGAEINDPYELFGADFIDCHFISDESFRARRRKCRDLSGYNGNPEALAADVRAGHDVMIGMAFGLTLLRDENPQAVARTCSEIFRTLPLAPTLIPAVSDIREKLKDAVAYHIRRGDLLSEISARNRAWPHKYVPDAYYHAHMQQTVDAGRSVVLFSDATECLEKFCNAFPKLKTIEQLVDFTDYSQGARDFLELYAMSACGTIIAPEQSAFSSTAAELGGVTKIDVKADLTPERLAWANERLLSAFQSDPKSLGEEAEISQAIPHMASYLEEADRWDDAVALYRTATLEQRLEASFLYPQALRVFALAGRHDLSKTLGDILPDCPVYHERDSVRASLPLAASAAARGDVEGCVKAIRNGLAYQIDAGELRRVVPILLAHGVLTHENFLPASPALMTLAGRATTPADMDPLETILLHAFELSREKLPRTNAYVEVLGLDWYPLLGNSKPNQFLQSRHGERFLEALETARKNNPDDADIVSMCGLVQALQGDTDFQDLNRAVEMNPTHALAWMRLAHGHWVKRNFQDAIDAAQSLAAQSSAPAFAAFASKLMQRSKDTWETALALSRKAVAAGWDFSPLYSNAIKIEALAGDPQQAAEAADMAVRLMPTASKMSEQYKLHMRLGHTARAFEILKRLNSLEKLGPNSYPVLTEMLRDNGEYDAARAVVSKGLERYSDRESLVNKLKEFETTLTQDK